MNYKEAFNKALDDNGYDILDNNFLFRSCLSDYVGNDYEGKEYIEIFYNINKTNLYKAIRPNSLEDAKNYIKQCFNPIKGSYKYISCIRSVEPLLLRLYPNKYKEVELTNKAKVPVNIKKKPIGNQVDGAERLLNAIQIAKDKREKNPLNIDRVNIHANCPSLNIITKKVRLPRIYSGMYDVTNNYLVTNANNELSISITDSHHHLLIVLPYKKYKVINLQFTGQCVEFFKVNNLCVKSKEYNFELNARKADMDIIGDSLNINAYCSVSLSTNCKSINLNSYKGNVTCKIKKCNYKQYSMNCVRGDLSLSFVDDKISSKISGFFQRFSCLTGVYPIGKQNVMLNLLTANGHIKVR